MSTDSFFAQLMARLQSIEARQLIAPIVQNPPINLEEVLRRLAIQKENELGAAKNHRI